MNEKEPKEKTDTPTLVEGIDEAIEIMGEILSSYYPLSQNPPSMVNLQIVYDTLTECKAALSEKPIAPGELESEYSQWLYKLQREYKEITLTGTGPLVRLLKALHSEVARLQGEAKILIDKIDTYDFECQGGVLKNCTQWIALKELINGEHK